MEEGIILRRIIDRETAKGVNFTEESLEAMPIKTDGVLSIVFLTALSLSCIVGIIGNTLVIGAIVVSKKLRTTGNMFIVNLAIADFVVVGIVEPFNMVGIIVGGSFFIDHIWMCHTVAIICVLACVCSMMNLAAISINRYVMINKHSYYSRIFTKKKTIFYCCFLWFIAFLVELPNLVGWGGHTFDLKTLGCSFDRLLSFPYVIFLSIAALWLPLSLIMFCYLKIYLYVRNSRRQLAKTMNTLTKDKKKQKRQKEDVHLARTFFIVFLSFLLCWAPYDITLFFDRDDQWPNWLYIVFLQIGHFNSSLNSILYGATNKRFRDGYKEFIIKICNVGRFQKDVRISDRSTTDTNLSSTSYDKV